MQLINEIIDIISSIEVNGSQYWSRSDGDIHTTRGFSTVDVLNTLGDIGFKANYSKIFLNAINFIFNYFDKKECFNYSA